MGEDKKNGRNITNVTLRPSTVRLRCEGYDQFHQSGYLCDWVGWNLSDHLHDSSQHAGHDYCERGLRLRLLKPIVASH
jgi:hypothetical protein